MEDTTNNLNAEDTGAAVMEPGIAPIRIEDEMRNSYIDYSMSVIVGRALPDARDGLKPVHRRSLYSMKELGNYHNKPYLKSARVVGEIMGKYHPHGDSSIYDTIVRMAQDFSMRYMLVDGQGNFGSIDGDSAAAMRYTEVRMARLTEEMLEDLDKDTVDMVPNYDEKLLQPTVLPSRLPNLLLNGSTGIAVGMATNIPPHNLNELCDAIVHYIDNPACTIDDLMQFVKGPDFPTGGIICGTRAIESMYKLGRGSIRVRGRVELTDTQILITEIPYVVNKAAMIENMARLCNEKVIEGIRDIRDESSKKGGLRVVIDLKKGAMGQVILNQLYKHTQLQTTFGANMLAIDKGRPKTMNLKQFLRCYVDHRFEVITRRTQFELRKAKERCHILEGLRIAIDNMDQVVRTIRESKNRDEARERLIAAFEFSEAQCNAILEMRLYQLTGLERDKVEAEYTAILARIVELEDILAKPARIYAIIKDDCAELKAKYGDARRTEITFAEGEVDIKDLIADEGCVVTLSHTGYVKRVPFTEFREQNRGGKGVRGSGLKDGDFVEQLFTCSTHDKLLFFTSHGRIFAEDAYKIPEASRTSDGRAIVNLLKLKRAETDDNTDEKVLKMLRIEGFDEKQTEGLYVFMATERGTVKKTRLADFKNVNISGIRAIEILPGDKLEGVMLVRDDDQVMLISEHGMSVRFNVSDVRTMGRSARGVRGIRLAGVTAGADETEDITEDIDNQIAAESRGDGIDDSDDAEDAATDNQSGTAAADKVCGLVKVEHGEEYRVLVCSETGYGKCTDFDAYTLRHRGGKGIRTLRTGDKIGNVVFAAAVRKTTDKADGEHIDGDSLMLITANGTLIRTGVDDIRDTGRVAKGVRVIRIDDNDRLVSASVIDPDDDAKTAPVAAIPSLAAETEPTEAADADAPAPDSATE